MTATSSKAGEVAAFLRANPGFLAENPELYAVLAPPKRVHGDIFADHMAAMLAAARADAAKVLSAGRAASGMAGRVQEAVLALFAAEDVAECVSAALPSLLGVDAASLCVEAPLGTARVVPAGTIARLSAGRPVLIRAGQGDAAVAHGEAARLAAHEALVRLPMAEPALLALVAREKLALDPAQGAAPLAFLARALAAALHR